MTKPISTSALSKSKIIDYEHLERYIGDDKQLLKEILGIFRNQASIWVNSFSSSLNSEEWYETAHALKGAAYGIGAWQIGDICVRAEDLSEEDNFDSKEHKVKRDKIVNELLRAFADLLTEIDRFIINRVLS